MTPSPLEPLYTLRVACELIPFPSVNALRVWLCRHSRDFPARYRRGSHHGRIRLLLRSEVYRIRAQIVTPVKPLRR